MIRRALAAVALLGLLASLALAAGACTRSENVLTVDDWSLAKADFLDELDQVAHNQAYVDARTAADDQFRVYTPGTTTYDPAFVAEFLNERITFRLVEQELAKRNLTVTDADRAAAEALIGAQLTPGTTAGTAAGPPGSTAGPAGSAPVAAVLAGFGSYRSTLVNGVASLLVLQRALGGGDITDDRLRATYEQVKDQYALQACVRHILVPSAGHDDDPVAAAKADELKARLDAGEDFAALAAEASGDQATAAKGGDLGCAPKGQYTAAFEDVVWSIPVGQVSGPTRTEFGYHLIEVTDRRTLAFEEVRDKLRDALEAQAQQALTDWLTGAAKQAKVVVDPAFGTWDASTGTVTAVGGGRGGLSLTPDEGGTVPPTAPPSSSAGGGG